MKRTSVEQQIQDNVIAIISLTVAIIALLYGTWRDEETEKNRTLRQAGFEVLKNLGELQIIVNHAFYQPESALGNPFMGWGHMALISDMSQLLPAPIPAAAEKLESVWSDNWEKIKKDKQAVDQVSEQIDTSRQAVLEAIRHFR